MRAKVSLALALALDPELLVLDEPTSGLDTLVRREFLESMVDRAAGGKTVLLASHQINEVERVADRVAILHEGRLLLDEDLDALKAEVREITVTVRNEAVDLPAMPEGLLSEQRRGWQRQILVRKPGATLLQHLRAHEAVSEVDVRAPSLEEIFVACMVGRGAASHDTPVEAHTETT